MLTGDELRKVQRREEKSEEINNELEFKKEKVEWDNLIILKNKVKELNEIEKLVFFWTLTRTKRNYKFGWSGGIFKANFAESEEGLAT